MMLYRDLPDSTEWINDSSAVYAGTWDSITEEWDGTACLTGLMVLQCEVKE